MISAFYKRNSLLMHAVRYVTAKCATVGTTAIFILVMVSFCTVIIQLSACKKEHGGNISNSNTDTAGLIHRLAGNYSVNYVCSHSNPYATLTYDTTLGATWSVTADTVPGNIIVNGATLHFVGNLSAKNYSFESAIVGYAGQNILFDSLFTGFTTQWGYAYTNCYGTGTRVP